MARQRITKTSTEAVRPAPDRDVFLWDDRIPGFGLKVTPKGRRIYVFQYRTGGKGTPTRRFTIGLHGRLTADQARREAGKLAERVGDGADPMAEKKRERGDTIEWLAEAFVEHLRQRNRRSADHVEKALQLHVVARWKSRPVVSIRRSECQALVQQIADRGHKTQARRIATHLHNMFKWARRGEHVKESPAADLDKPEPSDSRDRAPSLSEMVEIWNAAETLGWPFGHVVRLLILTAQRRDEVAGIGWSEINRPERTWTIPGLRAKNGLTHDVHLSDLALEIIDASPALADDEGNAVDLLFTTTNSTPVSGWGRVKKRLDAEILKARKQAAIDGARDPAKVRPMTPWVLHDIRRGVTTRLNDLGIPENIADRLLNHASKTKGGVKAIYNRAQYSAERRAAMAMWSDTLKAALQGARPQD